MGIHHYSGPLRHSSLDPALGYCEAFCGIYISCYEGKEWENKSWIQKLRDLLFCHVDPSHQIPPITPTTLGAGEFVDGTTICFVIYHWRSLILSSE